jgi:GxxExxY protein
MKPNELTYQIIGAAIEVHRELGPGKAEAAYESALAQELTLRGIPHQAQKAVPVIYKGVKLECGYRVDVLVDGRIVVEAKAVEMVIPVHKAQALTYLRMGGWKLALLLNFNVAVVKDGISRIVLGFEEETGMAIVRREATPEVFSADGSIPFLYSATDSGDKETESLAREIIAGALEVHRWLGPGLLPSAYEACLCHELNLRGLPFERKRPLPLTYKGAPLAQTDVLALLVGGRVVVNPRALPAVQPVHEMELLSQLRLGGWSLGLLLNFNTIALVDGLRRVVFSPGMGRIMSKPKP